MLRLLRRRKERPCPMCEKPVPADAERCGHCERRLRPPSTPLARQAGTDLAISEAAFQDLARRG